VSRALKTIRPEAVVLVEAEIWPNFLWSLRARRTPVLLVNARLSERSYRAYRRFGFLFRPLLATFAGVGAQSEADAPRWVELGCRPDAVCVTGSLKFETSRVDERRLLDVAALLRQLGVRPARRSSSAAARTRARRRCCRGLPPPARPASPALPRPGSAALRARKESDRAAATRDSFIYRREISATRQWPAGSLQALVVNTNRRTEVLLRGGHGHLCGKSLTTQGGQNPSSRVLGKPMVFGPHMQKLREIAARFVQGGAAVQVNDATELEGVLDGLLADPARRDEMGHNAARVVRSSGGALERTVTSLCASCLRTRPTCAVGLTRKSELRTSDLLQPRTDWIDASLFRHGIDSFDHVAAGHGGGPTSDCPARHRAGGVAG